MQTNIISSTRQDYIPNTQLDNIQTNTNLTRMQPTSSQELASDDNKKSLPVSAMQFRSCDKLYHALIEKGMIAQQGLPGLRWLSSHPPIVDVSQNKYFLQFLNSRKKLSGAYDFNLQISLSEIFVEIQESLKELGHAPSQLKQVDLVNSELILSIFLENFWEDNHSLFASAGFVDYEEISAPTILEKIMTNHKIQPNTFHIRSKLHESAMPHVIESLNKYLLALLVKRVDWKVHESRAIECLKNHFPEKYQEYLILENNHKKKLAALAETNNKNYALSISLEKIRYEFLLQTLVINYKKNPDVLWDLDATGKHRELSTTSSFNTDNDEQYHLSWIKKTGQMPLVSLPLTDALTSTDSQIQPVIAPQVWQDIIHALGKIHTPKDEKTLTTDSWMELLVDNLHGVHAVNESTEIMYFKRLLSEIKDTTGFIEHLTNYLKNKFPSDDDSQIAMAILVCSSRSVQMKKVNRNILFSEIVERLNLPSIQSPLLKQIVSDVKGDKVTFEGITAILQMASLIQVNITTDSVIPLKAVLINSGNQPSCLINLSEEKDIHLSLPFDYQKAMNVFFSLNSKNVNLFPYMYYLALMIPEHVKDDGKQSPLIPFISALTLNCLLTYSDKCIESKDTFLNVLGQFVEISLVKLSISPPLSIRVLKELPSTLQRISKYTNLQNHICAYFEIPQTIYSDKTIDWSQYILILLEKHKVDKQKDSESLPENNLNGSPKIFPFLEAAKEVLKEKVKPNNNIPDDNKFLYLLEIFKQAIECKKIDMACTLINQNHQLFSDEKIYVSWILQLKELIKPIGNQAERVCQTSLLANTIRSLLENKSTDALPLSDKIKLSEWDLLDTINLLHSVYENDTANQFLNFCLKKKYISFDVAWKDYLVPNINRKELSKALSICQGSTLFPKGKYQDKWSVILRLAYTQSVEGFQDEEEELINFCLEQAKKLIKQGSTELIPNNNFEEKGLEWLIKKINVRGIPEAAVKILNHFHNKPFSTEVDKKLVQSTCFILLSQNKVEMAFSLWLQNLATLRATSGPLGHLRVQLIEKFSQSNLAKKAKNLEILSINFAPKSKNLCNRLLDIQIPKWIPATEKKPQGVFQEIEKHCQKELYPKLLPSLINVIPQLIKKGNINQAFKAYKLFLSFKNIKIEDSKNILEKLMQFLSENVMSEKDKTFLDNLFISHTPSPPVENVQSILKYLKLLNKENKLPKNSQDTIARIKNALTIASLTNADWSTLDNILSNKNVPINDLPVCSLLPFIKFLKTQSIHQFPQGLNKIIEHLSIQNNTEDLLAILELACVPFNHCLSNVHKHHELYEKACSELSLSSLRSESQISTLQTKFSDYLPANSLNYLRFLRVLNNKKNKNLVSQLLENCRQEMIKDPILFFDLLTQNDITNFRIFSYLLSILQQKKHPKSLQEFISSKFLELYYKETTNPAYFLEATCYATDCLKISQSSELLFYFLVDDFIPIENDPIQRTSHQGVSNVIYQETHYRMMIEAIRQAQNLGDAGILQKTFQKVRILRTCGFSIETISSEIGKKQFFHVMSQDKLLIESLLNSITDKNYIYISQIINSHIKILEEVFIRKHITPDEKIKFNIPITAWLDRLIKKCGVVTSLTQIKDKRDFVESFRFWVDNNADPITEAKKKPDAAYKQLKWDLLPIFESIPIKEDEDIQVYFWYLMSELLTDLGQRSNASEKTLVKKFCNVYLEALLKNPQTNSTTEFLAITLHPKFKLLFLETEINDFRLNVLKNALEQNAEEPQKTSVNFISICNALMPFHTKDEKVREKLHQDFLTLILKFSLEPDNEALINVFLFVLNEKKTHLPQMATFIEKYVEGLLEKIDFGNHDRYIWNSQLLNCLLSFFIKIPNKHMFDKIFIAMAVKSLTGKRFDYIEKIVEEVSKTNSVTKPILLAQLDLILNGGISKSALILWSKLINEKGKQVFEDSIKSLCSSGSYVAIARAWEIITNCYIASQSLGCIKTMGDHLLKAIDKLSHEDQKTMFIANESSRVELFQGLANEKNADLKVIRYLRELYLEQIFKIHDPSSLKGNEKSDEIYYTTHKTICEIALCIFNEWLDILHKEESPIDSYNKVLSFFPQLIGMIHDNTQENKEQLTIAFLKLSNKDLNFALSPLQERLKGTYSKIIHYKKELSQMLVEINMVIAEEFAAMAKQLNFENVEKFIMHVEIHEK